MSAMTNTIDIVDPHIHLWDLSTGLYPGLETPSTGFIGNNAPIARSYLLDEFLAEGGDTVRITGAVHVEAFPTDPVAETRHLQSIADASPIPLAIVANADLSAPDVEAILEAHAIHSAFRGIRQVVNRHPDPLYNYVATDFLLDPAWRRGFKLLPRFNASFDLQLYPHQFAAAAEIAADNPDTAIIVNHAGMWADRNLPGWRLWRDGLRSLAALPNIAIKISGLGMFDHHWTPNSLRPLVLETLDAFGTDRAMFASNFPVDKLFSTYADLWRAYAGIIADLSQTEQAALLSGNARNLYRL
jgi:predicted TIM-barrel fold metal-dependent hydrolase